MKKKPRAFSRILEDAIFFVKLTEFPKKSENSFKV